MATSTFPLQSCRRTRRPPAGWRRSASMWHGSESITAFAPPLASEEGNMSGLLPPIDEGAIVAASLKPPPAIEEKLTGARIDCCIF